MCRRKEASIPCRSIRITQQKKKSEVSFSEDPQFHLILRDMYVYIPVRRNSYSQEYYPLTNFVRCLAYL